MAGPIDPSLRKFHASLNVSDLERSIAFYQVLLGTPPAKVRPKYAKFDIAEPPLVLSLIPGSPGAGSLNHAGLRVRTADELVDIQHRLEAAGLHTRREDGVQCCHATQTKFWVTDPDRVLWEVYIFHADVDDEEEATAPASEVVQPDASAPKPSPKAWEHRLTDAIPSRIPHDDNSLHEIRLEGSINVLPETPNRRELFIDALRALRPAAAIYVHGLAGDRTSTTKPSLPGPAAPVQHVPSTCEVVEEIAGAGFVDIQIETLSEKAYFVVDGVPMRELRVIARKPGHRPKVATHQAIYLGPMKQVTDDFGNVYQRGMATAINVHDWQVLSKGAGRESFLLLAPEGAKGSAAGRSTPPTPRSA
jgi:catechol 2,3-dioxygenase-like lactoylglutathione lyase family enzyme